MAAGNTTNFPKLRKNIVKSKRTGSKTSEGTLSNDEKSSTTATAATNLAMGSAWLADKTKFFEKLTKRAKNRKCREYYSGQVELLNNIVEDRTHIKKFVEKNTMIATESMKSSRRNEDTVDRSRCRVRFVVISSLYVNVSLAVIKAVASILSGSLAIISSLIDSTLDLVSGAVTYYTMREIRRRDPYLYPRGCTRMEPLGSVIVSVIMGVANIHIISKSCESMAAGDLSINVEWPTIVMMSLTILAKLILFLCCKWANHSQLDTLKLDHRNDCISNTVAIGCACLATYFWKYFDPIGAILVSGYICITWFFSGRQHMRILSGRAAKPEFYCRILHVALDHQPNFVRQIDTLKVYHMGSQFLVELDIVLDKDMPVHQAHDISELLQRKIEYLPYVERAFVHVDHESNHNPEEEHKVV
uniref:Cation efflux protein cytoplasmic domain-containing protein n=1 Tax=Romanomermis culicivorax TaxID=13658 RepID=A0A915LAT1_ROMCU